MFKAGERVIHHRFGEGVLKENLDVNRNTYPLAFVNESHGWFWLTSDGREEETDLYPSIYYVPQTFDMSKPEPAIGTWGYFWDVEDVFAALAMLCDVLHGKKEKYRASNGLKYENFSPEIPPHIKELMNGGNTDNP